MAVIIIEFCKDCGKALGGKEFFRKSILTYVQEKPSKKLCKRCMQIKNRVNKLESKRTKNIENPDSIKGKSEIEKLLEIAWRNGAAIRKKINRKSTSRKRSL